MAEKICPKLKPERMEVEVGNMSIQGATSEPQSIDLVPPHRFGEVLHSVRTNFNRSPEEVAFSSRGRFSPAMLREFELGDRRLSAATVDELVRAYGIAYESSLRPMHYRLELDELPLDGGRPAPASPVDMLCRYLAATQPAATGSPRLTVVAREADLARLSAELTIERGALERTLLALPSAEPDRLRAHRAEIAELARFPTLPVLVGYTPSTCLLLEPDV